MNWFIISVLVTMTNPPLFTNWTWYATPYTKANCEAAAAKLVSESPVKPSQKYVAVCVQL